MARLRGEDVKERVERRMARIDALSPELRAVVHDLGWSVVEAFLQNGVNKPRQIRRLVQVVVHDYLGRQ